MNKFQTTLYNDLINLTEQKPDVFVKKMFSQEDGSFFEIFNYKLAKKSDFELPNAMNCRGTMFYTYPDKQTKKLIALPMQKFFSLGEGGKKDNKFKIENADSATIKEDGSLVTAYFCPMKNKVEFKSQNVPVFHQYDLIQELDQHFKECLVKLVENGYSVDFELTSPKNRVVIEYNEVKSHIILIRNLENGKTTFANTEEFNTQFPELTHYCVKTINVKDIDIYRKDIEGYVLNFQGETKKLKTIPFLDVVSVVQIQDKTKLKENLFKAALSGVMDEIRSLYYYKANSENYPLERFIKQADEAEKYAIDTYNEYKKNVQEFLENNKDLSKEEFTKKAVEMGKDYTPTLMQIYNNKEVNLKQTVIRLYSKKY